MKDNDFDKHIDWTSLNEKFKEHMPRNKTLIAVMPQHPPIRLLSNLTEGIYPPREMFFFKKNKNK
jgi:hypothetical protein